MYLVSICKLFESDEQKNKKRGDKNVNDEPIKNTATIIAWWNGIEVSSGVQNLGDGLYSIVLDPIIVKSGEAPILLNMILSALGYGEKYLVAYSERSNDQKIIYLLVGL